MGGTREPPIAVPMGCSGSVEDECKAWGWTRPGYARPTYRATVSGPLPTGVSRRAVMGRRVVVAGALVLLAASMTIAGGEAQTK